MTQRSLSLSLCLPLLLGACQPGESGSKSAPQQHDETAPKDSPPATTPPPSPAGNPLAALGPLTAMMAQNLEQPGPYDAPTKSKDFDKDATHWLTYELKGPIDDLSPMSLLGGGGEAIELRTLSERLRKAAADPKVRGLVLRLNDPQLDMASAQDLRAALLSFKGASGVRRLTCHTDGASNIAYYLMTACDRIGLQPLGEIALTGPAATPIHLKGLLDRLGVEADFVHVGAFKGAAEPLTRREPSKEMLATLDAIIQQVYDSMLESLMLSRGFSKDEAIKIIDTGMFFADAAVKANLVDEVTPYEDFRTASTEGAPWTRMKLKEGAGPAGFDLGKLQVFLGMIPATRPSEPHVALVYAVGNIIDGRGGGLIGARKEIAGRTLSAALQNLAADDKVSAVVLRVNSGGGSAQASEEIWRSVAALKLKKPVYVSMGRVAASGGYYISTGATKIFAQPDTLTGSIGVVGGKLALGGMLKNVGVDTYSLAKGKHASMWSAMTVWTPEERALVLTMMEDVYKVFVGRVSEGRGKTYDQVHALAQGRVWTGAAALQHGLVDAIGDLELVLDEARLASKIGKEVPVEVYPPEPTLKDMLEGLADSSPGDLLGRAEVLTALAQVRAELGPGAVKAVVETLGQALQLRQTPVLTATMLPLTIE